MGADIGIAREVRRGEHRVALTPWGVKSLVERGHRVWVQSGAGAEAGHPDGDYESAGARIAFNRMEPFARAGLVAAVSAPEPPDYDLLQPEQVVFAFWHLPAARPEDLQALLERRVSAVGLEAIEAPGGHAPVLTSMSEIAGSIAVTVGGGLLMNQFGGKGILLGGAPGVPPAHFAVVGAGVVGCTAARGALDAGADVTLLDVDLERLRDAARRLPRGVTTMLASRANLEKVLGFADLVLGAVAVHGRRAPLVVTRDMLRLMKPRSVVMDLSIDMGGCFETSRPTAFPNPVYEMDGVQHFCVPNLPAMAARSSTLALTNATLPYLQEVAELGLERALDARAELRRGVYLTGGRCLRESLARAFGLPWAPRDAGAGSAPT